MRKGASAGFVRLTTAKIRLSLAPHLSKLCLLSSSDFERSSVGSLTGNYGKVQLRQAFTP